MGRILRPILLMLTLAGLTLASASVRAQTVVKTPNVTAELIAEHASVQPGGTLWLALRLKIRPGWHTYWRNPGDSGQPTQVEWTLPDGYKAGAIVWTAPHHHRVGPLMNYGYADEAVHLIPISVPKDAKPGTMVTLKARGLWLVCEKICVPEEARFSVSVFVGAEAPAVNTQFEDVFTKARQQVAQKSPWIATVHRSGKKLLLQLKGAALRRDKVQEVWFYPFKPGVIRHVKPQVPNFGSKVFTLWMTAKKLATGKPLEGVLVITEKLDRGLSRQAFVIRARPGDPALAAGGDGAAGNGGAANTADGTQAGGSDGGLTIFMALIFALIGGIILNLMPCVLPVLSMKALGLAQHARADGAAQRRHGWVYTAGVLVTFALITVLLLLLRAGGQEIGWGYQLQSPVVVLVLAWVMFVIGLYLVGLFEMGGSVAGIGGGLATRGGYSGSFFTGMLAVVAAAPCTVPFMGAAMGFAFVQSWPLTIVVMLALGLGLALPFLILSHAPALLRFIPKPGPWMVRFKQFLSFPMFGTAVWLVWVLTLQAGDLALIAALGGAVLIAFTIWLMRLAGAVTGVSRGVALVSAVLAVFAIGGLTQYALQEADRQTAANGGRTVTASDVPLFTPARLAAARASGKAVFVNYTAAWCVTCIVNEKRVLSADWFRTEMTKAGIVYMKGDWTRRDPAITRELKKFRRLGVPLYVFYPAAGSRLRPEVLPQILTETRLRAAIEKYATKTRQRAAKR